MTVMFDVKKRLGHGYFGEVWHAIDTGLQYEVAVKYIPKAKIINKNNFFQEAQILKAVEHPNIVKVYETGEMEDGRIYVSMEYLPNGSLEDEAQGGIMALSRAKKIMIDVLRGLQHAHGKGVLHRDIKPGNILIGNNNEGKLSDFGLALPGIAGLDLTYLKKYQYQMHLAPEVEKLEDYSELADIYSCGVTLYRLVNGDHGLPQLSIPEIVDRAKVGKFPPRNQYKLFIPLSLRRFINKAMNVDPGKRFSSADEMRHSLGQQALDVDWEEYTVPNGNIWVGLDTKGRFIRVRQLKSSNGNWFVETKIGKDQMKLRRLSKCCFTGLSKGKAIVKAKDVLQNFSRRTPGSYLAF